MAFKPPANFDFVRPAGWAEWRQRFGRYRVASKLMKEDGEIQVSSLIYSMGNEAEKIFSQFNLNAEDSKKYDVVLEKFNEYFLPKKNVIHERAKFHRREQKEEESVEQYIRALYDLSEYAEFAEKETTIRDRLVLGVVDKELSQKLQLESDLDLQKAMRIARQHEQVTQQLKEQRQSTSGATASVDSTNRDQKWKFKKHANPRHTGAWNDKKNCTKCGTVHKDSECPTKGKKCHKCQKLSHFARCCKSKTVSRVNAQKETETSESSSKPQEYFIDSVNSDESPWRENLTVCGQQLTFKIDTGADVNVISSKTYHSLKTPPKLKKTKLVLNSPGGRLQVLGQFETKVGDVCLTVFVVKHDTECLLSRKSATEMNFVKRVCEIFSSVKCEPVRIKLKENAVPYSVSTARRVPIPLLGKVEKELKRMKDNGVIEEVKEPTEWVSPMVPVVKPSGDVRICVDLKKLNQNVERERYMIPTVEETIQRLEGSKVFSRLDARSGFWQIPLHEDSAKLTTFITPFGRYYMKRVPFGISSAPEIFQRIMTEILGDIEGVICCYDDIMLHSSTNEEHDKLLKQVFQRLKEVGLELNEDKCEYKKTELKFLGHVISENGVRPDESKVEAIVKMKEPENVEELRRYLGMVNYLGRYVPHLSTVLQPLNSLLVKETAWLWGHAQVSAFTRVKELLTSAPTLAFFDPTKPTVVSADASSYGIGGVLLQEHEEGLRPVAFCSRTLSQTETRYAQIEKECLASVWSCEKFDKFLMGLDTFRLITDHKPLVTLINNKDLSETPLRCQRMLMRLMRYKPIAEYTAGKNMVVADLLSRSPASTEADTSRTEDISSHVSVVYASWPVSDTKLKQIREETAKDVNLKTAFDYTVAGWPEYKQDVMLAARDFFTIRGELSVCDGLLIKGDRIVIPFSMRKEILDRIHDGHQGINKCRERANQSVWWPRISKDIQDRVAACRHCLEKRPSQPSEPLLPTELPDRPFQKIGVDLLEFQGKHYLVMKDYYSRYIDIAYLSSTTAYAVICKMKNSFAHHGIPESVVSDNGTQFTSEEFRKFASDWNFQQQTSSPRFPQANGGAERAVDTAKAILRQDDIFLALLTYRATPIPELGASPAELAFGRRLRTTLPSLPTNFTPRTVNHDQLRVKDEAFKAKQKFHHDRHRGAQQLPELQPGDPVLIKHDGEKGWKLPGEVTKMVAPRSYLVQTDKGPLRRNRRHLRYRSSNDSAGETNNTSGPVIVPDALRHSPEPQQTPTPAPDESPPPDEPTAHQPSSGGYHTRSGRAVVKPARFLQE
ncbi:hypothetical protein V1264_007018 [Littorina saxatilis]|uniref:Endonuclease n=1 Tax=Littorina saxatilis TaxID=31220 RepID=A0AAN9G2R3_9CAEN